MIYFKNSALIIGAVKRILKPIFKLIDKVIAKFNLYLFVTVLIVGAIMFLLGVFESNKNAEYFFYGGLAVSLLYAFIKTKDKAVKSKAEKKNDKRNNNRNPVIETVEEKQPPTQDESTTQNITNTPYDRQVPSYQAYTEQENTPKYFNVRGKPGYVMAEYVDRYELFIKTPNGLKKVREDKKY